MMLRNRESWIVLAAFVLSGLSAARPAQSDEPPATRTVTLADGKYSLEAPASWVRKAPKTRIVEHEFAIPKVGGDMADGRFTVMGAGGGVQANIDRWIGQFTQPDGSSTKDKAKVQVLKVGGTEIHYVDISGDYKDQAGPFAPAVLLENYRMLGAIVVTPKDGQHFLKLYGPKATIGPQEKAFLDMLNGLKAK